MNPFEQWRTVTSSEAWAKKPPEEKEVIRKGFVDKYSAGDEEARKGFDYSTRDLENDVFNDPEFQELDNNIQEKYILGNIIASGKYKGDRAKIEASRLYEGYVGSAAVAGAKRTGLGVAQTFANVPKEAMPTGVFSTVKAGVDSLLGSPEEINKAIVEQDKIAKRAPVAAITGEVAASIVPAAIVPQATLVKGAATLGPKAVALAETASKLPYVGRFLNTTPILATNAAESYAIAPVSVTGGTPEEQQAAVRAGKTNAGMLGGAIPFAVGAVTSPMVKEVAGNTGRYLSAVVSKEGRYADIGDDLLRNIKERFPDATPEQIVKDLNELSTALTQSKTPFTGDLGAELLNRNKAAQVFTDMQTNIPGTKVDKFIVDNFSTKKLQEAKVLQDAASAAAPANKSIFQKVRSKYIDDPINEAKVALDAEVQLIEKEANKAVTTAFAPLKDLPAGDLGDLRKLTEDWLNSETVKPNAASASSLTAISNITKAPLAGPKKSSIMDVTGKPAFTTVGEKVPLTAKNAQEYIASTFRDVTAEGGTVAKQYLDEVLFPYFKSVGANLDGAKALSDKIYTQSSKAALDAKSAAAFQRRATVKADGNTAIQLLSEPVDFSAKLKTALNKGSLTADHIKVLAKDPDIGTEAVGTLRAGILADMADLLQFKKAGKVTENDIVEFGAKYGNEETEAAVRELFKGDKKLLDAFDTVLAPAKSANTYKQMAASGVDEATGSASNLVRAAGAQASPLRAQANTGVFNSASELLKWRARRELRASAADKQAALKIINKAEKIGKDRINYTQLWEEVQGVRGVGNRAGMVAASQGSSAELDEPVASEVTPTPVETPPEPTTPLTEPQNNGTIDTELEAIGVSPQFKEVAANFAGAESGWGTNAGKNPNSSAQGELQFIDSTWKEMEAKAGRPLDRNSRADNILAGAIYAEKNAATLSNAGVPLTPSNLYLAHHFDGKGAVKLIKAAAGNNEKAYTLFPQDVVTSNPKWFFAQPVMEQDVNGKQVLTKGKGPYTAAQTLQKIKEYYKSKTTDSPEKQSYMQSITSTSAA